MGFSLLNIFKRKAKDEPAVEPAPAPRSIVEKSSGERLHKTVMPNATRTVASQPEPAFASPGSPMGGSMTATMPAPVMAAPTVPRTVAFAPSEPSKPAGVPPAVAVQLEPTVERAVALELGEIVGQMPPGWVRPLEGDEPNRRVLLRAAELERGMASGKPSVAIASIYDQVPEVFTRSVSSSETARVMLPFAKVLEEFAALHVRSDQRPEAAVPQVETPFLKVTAEDSERFGIAPTPIAAPSVRVEPATAETLAAAEPEAAYREKIVPGPTPAAVPMRIPVPGNGSSNGDGAPKAAPAPAAKNPPVAAPAPAPAAPARIPFKLTPNGTGVPATERVPASSGPSVPTSLANGGAPARIPFKISAPSEAARPKGGEGWITKESFQADADDTPAVPVLAPRPADAQSGNGNGTKISLALGPIFRNLPPFQLLGDADEVATDARVEFPFSFVEPQLATGRVTLTPEQFAAALPDEYRGMFNPGDSAATVSLPLQEVLKNLPATSLRMRDDQEEQEKGSAFATPFSAKAEEDAKRFKVAAAPVPKPVVKAAPAPAAPEPVAKIATPAPALKVVEAPRVLPPPEPEAPVAARAPIRIAAAPAATKGDRTELQIALDTDEELDPKNVVAHIGKMPGVKGCAIIFADGLSLAGNLPEEFNTDGISAMAPSMMQKIANHMGDSQLGELRAMTLTCANAGVTFLTHDNLCLATLHAKEELTADVRERLAVAVQELAKTYSQPA